MLRKCLSWTTIVYKFIYQGMKAVIAYRNNPKAIYHKSLLYVWTFIFFLQIYLLLYIYCIVAQHPYSHWLLFKSLVYIRKHFFFIYQCEYLFHTINEGFACLRLLIYVMFENIKRNCFSIFPFVLPILVWWSWLIITHSHSKTYKLHSFIFCYSLRFFMSFSLDSISVWFW